MFCERGGARTLNKRLKRPLLCHWATRPSHNAFILAPSRKFVNKFDKICDFFRFIFVTIKVNEHQAGKLLQRSLHNCLATELRQSKFGCINNSNFENIESYLRCFDMLKTLFCDSMEGICGQKDHAIFKKGSKQYEQI